MLSRSTLKSELEKYRASLKPARPDDQGRLIGNRNSADLQLLDRWIKRCDRENLDEKLWKSLRDLITAPELIRLILEGRRKAQATVNQIYGGKWKGPSANEVRRIREKRQGEERKRVDFGPRVPPLVQIATDTEIAGLNKEWRELKKELTGNLSLANLDTLERAHYLHATYSDLVSQFNEEPRQRDDGGTRLKRLFWDFVGSYLQIRFGKWFDNEIAILTEIAFDLPDGSVSPQHINHARRQR
jgi:hypothetical protein